jgi:hypothetical protein
MRNKAGMLSVKQLPIVFVLLAEISPISGHKTEPINSEQTFRKKN